MSKSLPPGWRRVRLGEVLEQVNRFEKVNPDQEYRLLGVKWYAQGVFERERKLGKAIAAKQLNRVEGGDFIYNRLFAWKGSFAIVEDVHAGGYVSGEFPVFRANPGEILAEFLYHHFSRPEVWRLIEHHSTGTTNVSRNRWREEQFLSRYISLPPLIQQEGIVAMLLGADEAIEANTEVIARMLDLKKSLTNEVLTRGIPGHHARFKRSPIGQLPEDWQLRRLAELAVVQTGLAKNKARHSNGSIDVPYLRVANVQDGYIDVAELKYVSVGSAEIARYSLQSGDVLLTEGGDNDKLGRGCVWDGRISPCLHQNHVFAVRCQPELLPKFLSIYTASVRGRQYFLSASKQTTNLASVNSTQLKALPVPLPDIREQQGICSAVENLEAGLRESAGHLQALIELRPNLTLGLLSGDIRVGFANQ